MGDRRGAMALWHRSFHCALVAVMLAVCPALSGCLGPKAVRYTRLRYNEVVRDTNDEQLLVNIVRLRYADSPVFIDLPGITSQFEVAGAGNYLGGYGNQAPGPASLGFGQLTMRDTPTLSYHPREGREIAKSLLNPLTADLFSVINAGGDIEQLLLLTTNDINDVSNAPRSTTITPNVGDDNTLFLEGIRLLAKLREHDGTELAIGTNEESEGASDPIPQAAIQGRDLLNAAKDGYVFRAQGKGQATLVKRDKDLVLKIRPQFVDSAEMKEIARIFHLKPGLHVYKIKSELSDEANLKRDEGNQLAHKSDGNDTFYMNMRSVLQIMTFLSKGVCVPNDHIMNGIVPTTPDVDGQPFDWTPVTAGNFHVYAQKHRPRDAEVAVPYRGYWFYIASDDVKSRAALSMLEILFALQESGEKSAGPVLTLPVGG